MSYCIWNVVNICIEGMKFSFINTISTTLSVSNFFCQHTVPIVLFENLCSNFIILINEKILNDNSNLPI